MDLLTTGWPLRPGSLEWRYGFLGIMTAYFHTPMLAMALAIGLAFSLRHRLTLRFLSLLNILGAFSLLCAMVLFALDVIQLRSATPAENLSFFQTGALLSGLKHFTAFITVSLLGFGGWRTAGWMSRRPRSAEASDITAEVLKAQKRD